MFLTWAMFSIFLITYATGMCVVVLESDLDDDNLFVLIGALIWPGYLAFILLWFVLKTIYNLRNK